MHALGGAGFVELDRRFGGGVEHAAFDLAHHMHFAGFAIKTQGQLFLAVDELQGFGPDGALHARHALGLFGAQAQGVAHAVLGDHQADFAFFLVGLIRCGNHLHAVFGVELAGFVVEHVGQVGEGVFRVSGRRLYGLGPWQALQPLGTGGFKRRHGFAAQRIEL